MGNEKMIGLNAPREQEIGAGPHVWIQWKGTDVCCDFHCACGAAGHFDGDFMYGLICPVCKQSYEVGTHVTLYPISDESGWWVGNPKVPEVDDA